MDTKKMCVCACVFGDVVRSLEQFCGRFLDNWTKYVVDCPGFLSQPTRDLITGHTVWYTFLHKHHIRYRPVFNWNKEATVSNCFMISIIRQHSSHPHPQHLLPRQVPAESKTFCSENLMLWRAKWVLHEFAVATWTAGDTTEQRIIKMRRFEHVVGAASVV
jgi:hypothetical protein